MLKNKKNSGFILAILILILVGCTPDNTEENVDEDIPPRLREGFNIEEEISDTVESESNNIRIIEDE